MNTVLYLSASGASYETRAYTTADITDLVQAQGLQALTSTDRQFDFWFSPSARGCQRRINRTATELLLATTSLGARNVPLLRGGVVIAGHDADGDLDGLSWQQLDLLVDRHRALSAGNLRTLCRRMNRDERQRRRAIAARTARTTDVTPTAARTPVSH
ncbi:hypothetical protein [Mycolicibacterium bacteremicum]|uniref:Uncharacterized protein n=1 Tax=Mycolicibacterium bacteremicum TaxID=564198 RepID=A0A1W9YTQ5_MYCBA|nr:hypothetical protein [Mycolicibacterium bacteremicum]MCV7432967.1 hypothetical protein [Mycolicibacterium bacteremicum]ORA03302.1 hypothetical protein BST17_19540 [Mycolicibacterium bacteremicum]